MYADEEGKIPMPESSGDGEIKFENPYPHIINFHDKEYTHLLSVKKIEHCLYSRKSGNSGKRILGYSIRFRLFNKDII